MHLAIAETIFGVLSLSLSLSHIEVTIGDLDEGIR